jgi:subtilisin-like proprotein convertase family protein
MKLTAILAAACLAVSAQAQLIVTNVFEQTVNTLIPDANTTGLTSTQNVSGISIAGGIQRLEVTLNITGGWNGDLYAYLAFGDGFAVLLNRVGSSSSDPYGYGDAGFNITLSDAATTDIHLYGGNSGTQLVGTFQPDGRNVDPQLVVGTDPQTAMLSSFIGLDPNGTWTLFVADFATGYQSTLVNWSLTVVTVPEPTSLQFLTVFGGLAAAGIRWRQWRHGKPPTKS